MDYVLKTDGFYRALKGTMMTARAHIMRRLPRLRKRQPRRNERPERRSRDGPLLGLCKGLPGVARRFRARVQ